MGRLLLLLLVILALVLLWRAFGPASWQSAETTEPVIKGPDDDEEFLWSIEKQRFKERREAERAAEREEYHKQMTQRLGQQGTSADTPPSGTAQPSGEAGAQGTDDESDARGSGETRKGSIRKPTRGSREPGAGTETPDGAS